MDGRKFLSKLCQATGVSGNEYGLFDILEDSFKAYTDEIITGKLGDFIAVKKGTGNGKFKIMISAHADEVGLMVTDIDERGFVHFTTVGGIDAKTLPAQEVTIHGKGEVYGVIGAKPPHVLTEEEIKKAAKVEDMLIDTGMSREENIKLISIGDYITVNRKCRKLLGDYISGKALDDRAGIASMLECAKELQKLNHFGDVYFTASTMEELGYMSVRTSTLMIEPDVGIAVDVTFGDKYCNSDIDLECGKGVEITVGPNIHPELGEKLMKIADEYNISYCVSVSPDSTGTDAWDMQIAGAGVPCLLISIPLRYMHTSTEVINYRDVISTGRLMALFISTIREWGDIYA